MISQIFAVAIFIVMFALIIVLAPFIGLLGSFMTGSNMSSNILSTASSRRRRSCLRSRHR